MLPPVEAAAYRKLPKEELVMRLWLAQMNICLGRSEGEAKVWADSLLFRPESWTKRPARRRVNRKASNR
jgi:hypothetical protein